MEGEGQPLTQEGESDLIQSAIDKIGEDMKVYLSGSIETIQEASTAFREQYPESENSQKYTKDNVVALIRKSMNDGLRELGIRCEEYDNTNPIYALTQSNFVHLGRHENAPRSPHSKPFSPYTRGLRRGKPFRPPSGPTVRKIRVVRPPTPKTLRFDGGNRTRRRSRVRR
jgi:hypothetical protein